MAVEDYLDSHVAVAVVATAAILSPRVRKVLRRGAVYGMTGVLLAKDAIDGVARDVKANTVTPTVPDPSLVDSDGNPVNQPAVGGS